MGFSWTAFLFFSLLVHLGSSLPSCQDSGSHGRASCNSFRSLDLRKPTGICMEKISNESFLNLIPHPDGSERVFVANQLGKIWLASVPEQGSGNLLQIDESKPFLDLTDRVHFENEFGLVGLAFHPRFMDNGRFFVSFNCDKTSWPGCSGKCSCNSDVNCDPSVLPSDNGALPCQFHSVISEFHVNGTSPQPSLATSAVPREVRRVFTMGLPFTTHHGGQILFGPEDGYLYFMMGDGGGTGDPYNFAQNKKSLLGKIMRLDVDGNSTRAGMWGNYSIPDDNPFSKNSSFQPEIWAMGFRNPWRCSFDSKRPSYFLCADVGQDLYEEVDMIKKGGNYGWRVYEGPYLHSSSKSARGISPIFPIMGYNHSEVSNSAGSASITGGYFYRSKTDPCLDGRYLFADLFADEIWAGTETPEDSGNFTSSKLIAACASDSPLPCITRSGIISPHSLGYLFSFGLDNSKDLFVLTSSGVFRVVRPSRCKFSCSEENATLPATSPASLLPPLPQIASAMLTDPVSELLLIFYVTAILLIA